MTDPSPEPPRWLRRLVLLLVWVAFAAILELGARVLGGGEFVFYSEYRNRPLVFGDPQLAVSLAPGFRGTLHNRDHYGQPGWHPWEVAINRHGWREPALDRVAPADTRRWMVVGDSVTYGLGLDVGKILTSELARHLARSEQSWQVLNRSVPSWSGWHQMTYLQQDGFAWDPDVVTVHVVVNDFDRWPDAYFEASRQLSPARERMVALLTASRFLNTVRLLVEKVRWSQAPSADHFAPDVPEERYGWHGVDPWWYISAWFQADKRAQAYATVNEVAFPRYLALQVCRERQITCVVVIHPSAAQVSPQYWRERPLDMRVLEARPAYEFESYLRGHDIDVLNLHPVMSAYAQGQTAAPLFIDEVHLSARGHAVVAEAVYARVVTALAVQ